MLKLLKHVFLFALLFASAAAFSQATLKGNASSSFGPLSGATVLVTPGDHSALTDDAGNYQLSLKEGSYTISISYAGFITATKKVKLAAAQILEQNFVLSAGANLDEVVIVGSRSVPRTQVSSPVPVDVFDLTKLSKVSPQVTINQLLTYAAPSFTANSQALGDGTDHVDPASIRGLGPDQVLVLINGKRRHNSALVNLNGTFGKGAVGTDLNAIPVAAIEKIEILRDGAAAQYGSDAIAGVINIILKKQTNVLSATVTGGSNVTRTNGENITDGETVQLALNYGLPIGSKGGFLNLSGTYDSRKATDRGGTFTGAIFRDYPGGVDKTDSFLNATGTTRKDYSLRVGQSQIKSGQFFYNSVIPVSENAEFYSFGGLGYRNGLAPGFYRLPNDSRNVRAVYPNGYLPHIGSNIYDRSFAAGIRGKVNGWDVDFSNTFGQNQFEFTVENSLNASLLTASPTSFKAGGPKFTQNTVNVDARNNFDVLSGLNLAFGTEYRFERYELLPSDENSYTNYGTAKQVGVDGNGNPILVLDPKGSINTIFGPDGTARPGGSQVFGGFRPENSVNATRTAVAGYGDVELNFSDAFLGSGAIRVENYSDFGSTVNGKLAFRYKINKALTLRTSGSTGFRAPSLQQRYYGNTSTLFVSGVPYEVGVFPNDSRAAKLVGIPSLSPEKSKSISAGITAKYGNLIVTLDGYFTRINDRVIFTDQFAGSIASGASQADIELYNILLQANATRASFFANAINTETKGLDAVVSYLLPVGRGSLRADVAGTISFTQRVGDIKASPLLAGKENIYFSNANKVYLENAVPNQKLNIGLTYTLDKFTAFLRNNYFGGVTEATNVLENQQFYNPRWVTDLTLSYSLIKNVTVSVGANNLLDVYPEKMAIAGNTNSGQFVYPRSATQFGFNGRYVFGRIAFNL